MRATHSAASSVSPGSAAAAARSADRPSRSLRIGRVTPVMLTMPVTLAIAVIPVSDSVAAAATGTRAQLHSAAATWACSSGGVRGSSEAISGRASLAPAWCMRAATPAASTGSWRSSSAAIRRAAAGPRMTSSSSTSASPVRRGAGLPSAVSAHPGRRARSTSAATTQATATAPSTAANTRGHATSAVAPTPPVTAPARLATPSRKPPTRPRISAGRRFWASFSAGASSAPSSTRAWTWTSAAAPSPPVIATSTAATAAPIGAISSAPPMPARASRRGAIATWATSITACDSARTPPRNWASAPASG